jgi:nitroimidazol reductase NimA-like FMN-containing flavoprotein (pyridoxamine 5'-phosphate oxidase superfamily)
MTTPPAPAPHASDLAQRISTRREEVGLSVEELATRAGIDPGYLAYFEASPDANLSGGSLLLIALALDTTPFELLGGSADRPEGHARALPHASLDVLTAEQCRTHLSVGGVGRIVFSTQRGPVALPVNFEFTEDQIVFSTDDEKASALSSGSTIGFEIDRADETLSEGWSVLVTGTCRRITDPEDVQRLSSLDLEAWAGGDRHALIAITPTETTGRVIVHSSPPDED